MREPALPHPESDRHVLCPFCDTVCERGNQRIATLCLGCGAAISASTEGTTIFDDSQPADRQAVAAAARQAYTPNGGGLEGGKRRRPVRLGKKS